MRKVRNFIWRTEYPMKALYQCAKIAQSLQYSIRTLLTLGFLCFYSKVWIYLICQQQQKIQRTNYTFFVKLTCFYQFERQEGDYKFLKSTLTVSDKYRHSANVFYCKTYTRGVFRTQPNICNKAFLWFSEGSSTIDIQLGSKYASAYI